MTVPSNRKPWLGIHLRSLSRLPQADRCHRCLGVSGRVCVAAEGGLARDRVGGEKPSDKRSRQATENQLTADWEEAGLGHINPEGEALAASPKRERAQFKLGIALARTRLTAATSSASEVKGFCTTLTW